MVVPRTFPQRWEAARRGAGRCAGSGSCCPVPPPTAACQETADGTEQGEELNRAATHRTKPLDSFESKARLALIAEALLVWGSSTILMEGGAVCGACDSRGLSPG